MTNEFKKRLILKILAIATASVGTAGLVGSGMEFLSANAELEDFCDNTGIYDKINKYHKFELDLSLERGEISIEEHRQMSGEPNDMSIKDFYEIGGMSKEDAQLYEQTIKGDIERVTTGFLASSTIFATGLGLYGAANYGKKENDESCM